jgi:hypothetical protein
MAAQPADGLGDGTSVTPIVIDVNVEGLSYAAASEYRHELIVAICNPGIEFEVAGAQGASDMEAYKKMLLRVEAHLATFGN